MRVTDQIVPDIGSTPRVGDQGIVEIQREDGTVVVKLDDGRRAILASWEDFNEQAKTLRMLLLENRELRAGWLMPGWTCANCQAFTGETKEGLSSCRCCGASRAFEPSP